MRVLLTRPEAEAACLASRLRDRGHTAIVSPVLKIHDIEGPKISFEEVQAIVATSANGIRALAKRTARRDIPVFAVGPQTTTAAEEAGFTAARNAGGDSTALADAVQRWAIPGGGALLYAAGRARSGELERILRDRGYVIRTEVVYDAVEQAALSGEAEAALAGGSVDAVMLFSARSAGIFARQVQAAGLGQHCAGLIAVCISDAVAKAAAALSFAEIRIAAQPNQEGMLALLG